MIRSNYLIWLATAVALFYTLTWSWPETIALVLLKGAAVSLLAVHCALTVQGRERWPLTTVFVLGALGDMFLQWHLIAGASFFAAGHVVAIRLYRRYQSPKLTNGARTLAIAVAMAATLISGAFMIAPLVISPPMPEEIVGAVGLALAAIVYIMVVAGMAVSLWQSKFRHSGAAALGALYFILSDVLIIGRLGPLAQAPLINEVIWALYIGAQVLICTGVIAGLRKMSDHRDSQPVTAAIGSTP